MTRRDLLDYIAAEHLNELNLLADKNADYAGDDDPFANLKRHGLYGILVRMDDKLARLENYVKSGRMVMDSETVRDTCRDLSNYANLFSAYAEVLFGTAAKGQAPTEKADGKA